MREPIIVQQQLNNAKKDVWEALTRQPKMIQWFFEDIPEFRAEVGFETAFLVQSEERSFPHKWKILEVIEGQKITYDWRYENYEGKGKVTFELSESEDGTLLTISNYGLESFDQTIPEFAEESCRAGWVYFAGRLHDFLTKN